MRASLIKTIYLSWLPIVILVISSFQEYDCQFIAHIDSKHLKGNITFDLREDELNNTNLVIESIIESKQSDFNNLKGDKEDDNVDLRRLILFEWTLHSNSLLPSMLGSCSNEELGPTILDGKSGKGLFEDRPIVLNNLNQFTIPLKEFLSFNSATSLSELIWSKSIKLKLKSGLYVDEKLNQKTDQPGQLESSALKPKINTNVPKAASGSTGLIRPSLSGPTPAPAAPASKPTFAPRPKPKLSGKLKTPPAATSATIIKPLLPKAEALVLEQATNSTRTTTTERETLIFNNVKTINKDNNSSLISSNSTIILENTNKYILKNYGNVVACANIIDTRGVKTAEAIYESQIAGKITLRNNEDGVTLISSNLYHIKSKVSTRHEWKILSSDILDNRRHEDECKYLQVLFDPDNNEDSNCQRNDTLKCKMGDLTRKHGQIQVGGLTKNTKQTFIDLNLPLSALEGSRALFIVIFELVSSGSSSSSRSYNILSCAQIKTLEERKVEALYNMDGVRGSIKISQRFITEPTTISYDLFGLEGNVRYQTIRQLPLMVRSTSDNNELCNSLGDVFDLGAQEKSFKTQNSLGELKVGNLSARHGPLSVIDSEYEDHYNGEYIDLYVQLFGIQSIIGRSILIHKNNGDPWVCSTIVYSNEPVSLAVAKFYYPLVGEITFQQLAHNSHSETGVLIELYNPNGIKSSAGHNWLIHMKPAMADFYNWSERCQSSGDLFDPIQVSLGITNEQYNKQCTQLSLLNEPLRCRAGDLSFKAGFKLTLPNLISDKRRYFYTDPFLPLSKLNSIIGKSIVIYDDNSPTQRGNRLACSTIRLVHPMRASIESWNSGPSIPSAVVGSIKFEQESPSKVTKININLAGFNGNVEHYAIHNVWTMDDKEFPCSNDSLYDIYDPFDSETSLRLPPSAHYGTSATVDRVKVGDMSRKHGTFEGLQSVQKFYLDSNVPLFASHSIIGRSMVLRAAVNDFRWVCGNIQLDYDKLEAREIIAMASFDEPRSKISGFVRFFQLEHKDGSLSDTFVHIDLRMQSDGIHELQTSEGHNWAIFVNQVGADAFIAADEVRCIAAGFKWNPYLAQDSLETYSSTCTPSEQGACAMGDLGMRHGQLTLGPNNRRSVSDSNLPLAGNYSVMGRSLIIFDNKRPTLKLACANIFPDIHVKSNVVIKRTPSFTVARFVEQMRDLLGAAEWLMVPELRATKSVAAGECVQMTIHFYGQKAHQMQIELNNLITLGTVSKETRIGKDKISTHYKLCRAGQLQLPTSTTISGSPAYHATNQLLLKTTSLLLAITTTYLTRFNFQLSLQHSLGG